MADSDEAPGLRPGEVVHMKESEGSCELHDMPTDGLARVLVTTARARHGKGGLNVCAACIRRAHDDARAKAFGR